MAQSPIAIDMGAQHGLIITTRHSMNENAMASAIPLANWTLSDHELDNGNND